MNQEQKEMILVAARQYAHAVQDYNLYISRGAVDFSSDDYRILAGDMEAKSDDLTTIIYRCEAEDDS